MFESKRLGRTRRRMGLEDAKEGWWMLRHKDVKPPDIVPVRARDVEGTPRVARSVLHRRGNSLAHVLCRHDPCPSSSAPGDAGAAPAWPPWSS